MNAGPPGAIGQSLGRLEDRRRLRGLATYVDDVTLPGMLHALVVRSTHAHARLRGIDADAALARPGVATVLTAAGMRATLDHPLPAIPIRLCPDPALNAFLQPPLAEERVRYVGEPLALIVAESRYQAEDAAAALAIDYEPLPAWTDAARTGPVGDPLFGSAPDNLASTIVEAFGDAAAEMAAAAHRVKLDFVSGRHSAVPMETRGLVAAYDSGSARLTVWGPTKVTHFNRGVLAALLGWPEHRIRLVEPEVGGGFGARGEFYPEDFLVPFAAWRLGRPVKWIEDRLEHLQAINHSRQQTYELELGLGPDGEFLALTARVVNDMGGYLRTHGTIVPGLSVGMLPGPYRMRAYRGEARCVLTNKTPTGTYRAPGRFECNAARERLIDRAAALLAMDPVALRRRNLIGPGEMPFERGTSILGERVVFDSGDYPGALAEAVRLSRYRPARAAPADSVADGNPDAGPPRFRRGMGLACFVEKTGTGPFEGARAMVDRSGEIVIGTGATDLGQGLETCLAQIAAEPLRLHPARITVRHGDTDLIPHGVGSFASRGTVMAGNAVHGAVQALAELLLDAAAARLGVPRDTLSLADGGRVLSENGAEIGFAELAAEPGLEATFYYRSRQMAYSHGVTVAAVRIDTATGQVTAEEIWIVYDVGRVINPRMVAGQIEGGVAQGIGGALLEELCYDESGQLLSGTFADYLLPSTTEMPRIAHQNLDRSPAPRNPLGVKGAGEIGIAGVGGAIANAVADALGERSPHGAAPVRNAAVANRLPLTPERVRRWCATRETQNA